MNNKFSMAIYGVALFLLLVSSGCLSHDTSENWPILAVKDRDIEFPDVKEGDKVTVQFEISNKGKEVLRIIEVKGNTPALYAYPMKEELPSGQSTFIKVIFDTTGRSGPQIKSQKLRIHLYTNDPEKLTSSLKLKGKVITGFRVKPRTVYTVKEGDNLVGLAKITNISNKNMVITKIVGETKRILAMATPPYKLPLVLKPNQSFSLDIVFMPTIKRTLDKKDDVIISVKGRPRPLRIPVKIKKR